MIRTSTRLASTILFVGGLSFGTVAVHAQCVPTQAAQAIHRGVVVGGALELRLELCACLGVLAIGDQPLN